MFFKVLTTAMICLFSYAVVVQFNDPDTLFWAAMYAIATVISIAAYLSFSMRGMLWVAFGLYGASVVWLSPNFAHTSMEAFASVGMNSEEEELVRELWGMVICLFWSLMLILHDGRKFPVETREEKESAEADELVCN